MKINELRIGNYFHLINTAGEIHIPDSTVFEIVGLPYDFIQCKRRDEQLHKMPTGPYIIGYSDASPILITPEWLERAGFRKVNHIHGYSFYKLGKSKVNKCHIDVYEDRTEYMGYLVNHCKYVHQLQNLHFSLTGKELEFKL